MEEIRPSNNDSLFSVSFSVSLFCAHDIDSYIYPALISSAVGVARFGVSFLRILRYTDIYFADALLLVFFLGFSGSFKFKSI